MAKVFRTRFFSVVHGVETTPDGDIVPVDHIVNGRYADKDNLKNKARKEFSNFLPVSYDLHKQVASLSEEDFYGNATLGDDEVYESSKFVDTDAEPVEEKDTTKKSK